MANIRMEILLNITKIRSEMEKSKEESESEISQSQSYNDEISKTASSVFNKAYKVNSLVRD